MHRILNGQELIRRTVAERILAVKARPAPGRYVNLTGTRRRIQALMAIGHTVTGIAHESSVDPSVITDILRGKIPRVRGVTAERIAAAYDWLGERPDTWSRKSATAASRNRAAREGWPPPAAWDDIDDPDSQPDWTGCCGTDRGWWMHKLEQLPMCGRCETAHADWLAEHRHLPQGERFKALGRARGEASGRGEAIAHDGRELMRVSGLDYEQAAERLGITKQHLQQELVRHPEMEAAA